jgi:hypothetical protein
VAPLSGVVPASYNGHPLGLVGTILVAVTVVLRVGWMLWRRRSRR